MLSRLSARSSVAARSLLSSSRMTAALPQMKRTEFLRSFNSSPTLQNAATEAPKADYLMPGGPGAIIDKYGGPATFWGMLATILVTKEMFILDAEFLLSLEIGTFFLAGYVMTGDTIDKMSREMDQKKADRFQEQNDFLVEMLNQYKLVMSTAQHKPEVMKQYKAEYEAAVVAHAKYQTVLPQHKARAAVLATLEQIKVKEEHAASQEWQEKVDSACANVRAQFMKGDAKLNAEMMTLAISSLGKPAPTTASNDPVKRLFMAEFEN